ncbi:hypothetical protein [Gilliamella sp. wkB171]|nr:hypothetical protein [Gilliamella apicola]
MPVYGLSSQTAKSINGSSPYLSFDNGKSASSTIMPLLSITLPNKVVISALQDNSSATNPIVIDKAPSTFSDIVTNMPFANYPSTTLANVVVTNNYWRDPDGDKLFTITGNMQIKWENAAGEDITNYVKSNPNSELDACKSPYKLTLSADDGALVTSYGIPDIGQFTGGSHSYYFYPSPPKVCYVQPNVAMDSSSYPYPGVNLSDLDGPDWVGGKGFVPKNPASSSSNFPSTGANNMEFYLILGGITPETVLSINGSTVTYDGSSTSMNAYARLSVQDTPGWGNSAKQKAIKVVLKSPGTNGAVLKDGVRPPSFPIFKIYSDTAKKNILYSFYLRRWYVPLTPRTYSSAYSTCKSLAGPYRLARMEDYTNANNVDINWNGGIPGRSVNIYRRQLSYKVNGKWIGGIFNEWGRTDNAPENYPNSAWLPTYYWAASDDGVTTSPYDVWSGAGNVHYWDQTINSRRAACVLDFY